MASLVAYGIKKYEFRTWKTNYRGKLLIHAGAGIDKDEMKKYVDLEIDFPKSKIIAIVDLVDCCLLDDELNKKIESLETENQELKELLKNLILHLMIKKKK